MRRSTLLPAAVLALTLIGACGSNGGSDSGRASEARAATTSVPPGSVADDATQQHPDVIAAVATLQSDGAWRFDVTLSSPYDTPERYADAWRVLDASGHELGRRDLRHDHANEQPFTRSLSGVVVPDDIDVVTIQGRDQQYGWGGATVEVRLER